MLLTCLQYLLLLSPISFLLAEDLAVLIHGCHLQADEWERIMFGDEKNEGRVSSGIKEAYERNAELIIWGSGGSSSSDGVKEGQYIFQKAIGSYLKSLADAIYLSSSQLLPFLLEKSVIETKSKNTCEEIESALQLCSERKIKRLLSVSSPTHIARCIQIGCKIKGSGKYKNIVILARASDTCYANCTPDDVVIIEPPHRNVRSQLPIHRLFQTAFKIFRQSDKKEKLYSEWMQRLSKYEISK